MEKELQNLLDNYEKSIYGKEVPKTPTMHQIHLLLDYIANQGIQLKKQQEINQKAIEYINTHKRKDGFLELNEWQARDLLQILEDKGGIK